MRAPTNPLGSVKVATTPSAVIVTELACARETECRSGATHAVIATCL